MFVLLDFLQRAVRFARSFPFEREPDSQRGPDGDEDVLDRAPPASPAFPSLRRGLAPRAVSFHTEIARRRLRRTSSSEPLRQRLRLKLRHVEDAGRRRPRVLPPEGPRRWGIQRGPAEPAGHFITQLPPAPVPAPVRAHRSNPAVPPGVSTCYSPTVSSPRRVSSCLRSRRRPRVLPPEGPRRWGIQRGPAELVGPFVAQPPPGLMPAHVVPTHRARP
jgi:hypothetical protein